MKKKGKRSGRKALTHRDTVLSGVDGLPWAGWILAALIVSAGAWAYSNSLDGAFVLDDQRAIVQNESIRRLSTALEPPGRSTVSGRPLANLTFALNYAIGGADVTGYHVLNVLVHLAAAMALFGVLRRTLARVPRLAVAPAGLAAAVVLVWVVHPLTTSAVTYVVQRVESLMSLFYLLTLYCAIRADGSARRGLWTATAVASCALGMATKEVMVTAPVAVALWDYVFRRGERPRWGLLAGLAATWLIFAALVSGESREASMALSPDMSWRYLLTQGEVLVRYLRLVFVPSPLIFLYSWPIAHSIGDVLPEALLVVALLAATIAGLVRRYPLAFAGAAFFLVLAPTSSVLPIVTEVAAEHRMYLPLAAVIAAAIGAGGALLAARPHAMRAAAVLVAVIVVLLGVQTRARNRDFVSDERLWADTVAKDPSNERARVAYALLLLSANRPQEAEPHLRAAADLGTTDPMVHRALGQMYGLRREDARAAAHLSKALDALPDDPTLLARLAALHADSRDPSVRNPGRAVALAERAVDMTGRQNAYALAVLAVAQAAAGRYAEAAGSAYEGLAIARREGNQALIAELDYRARAYSARAEGR